MNPTPRDWTNFADFSESSQFLQVPFDQGSLGLVNVRKRGSQLPIQGKRFLQTALRRLQIVQGTLDVAQVVQHPRHATPIDLGPLSRQLAPNRQGLLTAN